MKHYIESKPEIMRGALVIKGTRVPMVRILYLLSEGYSIDQIHDQYPWVPKKNLKGAITELAAKLENFKDDSKILQA